MISNLVAILREQEFGCIDKMNLQRTWEENGKNLKNVEIVRTLEVRFIALEVVVDDWVVFLLTRTRCMGSLDLLHWKKV